MERVFGERWQRARKEHFCDFCGDWIQPGQWYRRHLWICRDTLAVMKEHDQCPENEFATEHVRELHTEVVVVSLVLKQIAVVKVLANGETVVEQKLVIDMAIEPESEPFEDCDEEIPF